MILDGMPRMHSFFRAVVVYAFNPAGRVAMLQKSAKDNHYPNAWGFPAGRARVKRERIREAASREFREETGNSLVSAMFQEVDHPWALRHYTVRGKSFCFWCHTFTLQYGLYVTKVTIDPAEHQDCLFADPRDIKEGRIFPLIPDAREMFTAFHGN